MSGQTKYHSFIEALTSTAVGFIISYFLQVLLNWIYNIEMSYTVAFQYVIWFTVASVIRSYYIRRIGNWHQVRRGQHKN